MYSLQFICGCTAKLQSVERVVGEDEIIIVRRIDGNVHRDSEGMLICGTHGSRRHGWRSLPAVTVTDAEGNSIQTNRADYSLASYTPKAIEDFILEREGIVVG